MHKTGRSNISTLVHRRLSEVLLFQSSDPRFSKVTISRVETTPSLTSAKVYVSIFPTKRKEELIASLNQAKITFPKIKFDIVVVDYNSKKKDLEQIKKQLEKSNFKNSIISLDISEFINDIKKVNAKNEKVTENQMSNMSNIHKSLLVGKNQCNDLIYFVEDDYLHQQDSISEMIFTYERISSQINQELILCPADYPYLYTKIDPTNIFLGANKHWRKIDETLCTFLTSKILLVKYWKKFISMCQFEHYPFEQPLHDIYKIEYCLSPIPSLALHCTNVNSIYGLSPNIDWKKIWDENGVY